MKHEENAIHRTTVEHLKLLSKPNTYWWHSFNKAANAREGAFAKSMGVRAGVADLTLLRKGQGYALELKAEGGRMSAAQEAFAKEWREAGGKYSTAYGLDGALFVLREWGFI